MPVTLNSINARRVLDALVTFGAQRGCDLAHRLDIPRGAVTNSLVMLQRHELAFTLTVDDGGSRVRVWIPTLHGKRFVQAGAIAPGRLPAKTRALPLPLPVFRLPRVQAADRCIGPSDDDRCPTGAHVDVRTTRRCEACVQEWQRRRVARPPQTVDLRHRTPLAW